ncbi:hypothetical protein FACS1894120_4420 [Clostridia bacterium]|nr:hypothetical protein FACS1894120_4420 [Clostridia bacterium]
MEEFLPEGKLIDRVSNSRYTATKEGLAEAFREGRVLEADCILCDSHHNLYVDFGFCKGFIPRDEGAVGIAEGHVRDIALISRVNKPVSFVVTSLECDPDVSPECAVTLSRRLAQIKARDNYISKVRPGDILNVRVTHLEQFGCFVDLACGIPSMMPIDSISVSRISHPSVRFAIGDDIRGVVKTIDPAQNCQPGSGRITLTHKELLGSWDENAALFLPHETVPGVIRSIEQYGIFVELLPNLAGLAEVRPDAQINQKVSVYIKAIIPEKMKIKLAFVEMLQTDAYPSPEPFKYFTPSDITHIDNWLYASQLSGRTSGTTF